MKDGPRPFSKFIPRSAFEFLLGGLLVLCPIATWSCFTAWGIIVSWISAQIGVAADQLIARQQTKAEVLFAGMLTCQLLMLGAATELLTRMRRYSRAGITRFGNLFIALGVTLFVDIIVFGVFSVLQVVSASSMYR